MVERKKSTKAAGEGENVGDTQPVQIDPNTGEPYEEASGPADTANARGKGDPEAGAEVANDNFGVMVDNRDNVNVLPKGWVGPPPLVVHVSKLKDLISALQQVAKAKAPDTDEEFELTRDPNGLVQAEQKTPHQS